MSDRSRFRPPRAQTAYLERVLELLPARKGDVDHRVHLVLENDQVLHEGFVALLAASDLRHGAHASRRRPGTAQCLGASHHYKRLICAPCRCHVAGRRPRTLL